MKRALAILISILFSISCLFSQTSKYEPNVVIFKVKNGCVSKFMKSENFTSMESLFGRFDLHQEFPNAVKPEKEYNDLGQRMVDISTIYRVTFHSDVNVEDIIRHLAKNVNVVYAEPLCKVSLLEDSEYVPNDPYLSPTNVNADGVYQYWTDNIRAYEAWNISKGDTTIVIGISDTGSDLTHADLEGNIKINYDDLPDGIDNDNDGYVDNYKGWNFALDNNNAQLTPGVSNHGSMVSGISSAVVNNGIGVAGAGYNCKFVPLKIMNDEGSLVNVYNSIVYAANHHFDVVNCSWGSASYQQMGQDVINYAVINYDVLVVAAAGNDSIEERFYPAAFENVLSVAATDKNDYKWKKSSYSTTVDISAPGTMYITTGERGGYATAWGGTSFASPIVAGGAGIIRSYYPNYKAQQIAEIIRLSADNIDTLSYFTNTIISIDSTFVESFDSISVDSIWNEHLYPYDSISVDSIWSENLQAYEYDTIHNEIFIGGYEYDTVRYGEFDRYEYDTVFEQIFPNARFANMLGSGRFNLYRALTVQENELYSTLIHDMNVDRYDDVVDISGVVTNYLNSRTNMRVRLSVESPYVSAANEEIAFADFMGSMQSDSVTFSKGTGIRLNVLPDAPQELNVKLKLTFMSEELETDQVVDVLVNGGFVDVTAGDLSISVAGNGRLGYVDINSEVGHGCHLNDYFELFYDCGVIAGTSGSEIYSSVRQVSDFNVVEYPHFIDDTANLSHVAAKMLDSNDEYSRNLEYILDVYGGDGNFVIADYHIVNHSFTDVGDFYFGLFADWDLYEPVQNKTVFDNDGQFLYCVYDGPQSLYAGMKLLSGQHAINYSLPNKLGGDGAIDISDGFSDLEKFYMISNTSISNMEYDMVQYSGAGPFSIPSGDTISVAIALFAATSYYEMLEMENAAEEAYAVLQGTDDFVEELLEDDITLYPNPVADRVYFAEIVDNVSVYNATGKCVFNGENVACIDVSDFEDGLYYVVVLIDGFEHTGKFVKIK